MEPRTASGTIFIVDISGYSKFVRSISTEEGAMIMPILLKPIVGENVLSLRVAEIEGDAILFYRMGETVPVPNILSQFNKMFNAFVKEIESLKAKYPGITDLTIKAVVHYGQLSGYEIGGYYKLFGKVLVEAHRLLKNHINSKTYVIITRSFYNQQVKINQIGGIEMSEQYDIGNISYTYFSYPSIASQTSLCLAPEIF